MSFGFALPPAVLFVARRALRPLSFALLCASALTLSNCASKPDYSPKTAEEMDQDATEHRVFYSGWRHPDTSESDKEFYRKFWGLN